MGTPKAKPLPQVSECSCGACQRMCERSCWGTPDDIRKLIQAGFGSKLMLDWWIGEEDNIYVLCPAETGHEGRSAPSWPGMGCILQKNGLCTIHASGLKPTEGKVASCKGTPGHVHESMAATWDTEEGRALVEEWESKYAI